MKSKLSVLKAYDAISCEEEPQIISVDTFLSRSGMYSLFLKSDLHMVTSFQRVQHEKGRGGKVTLQWQDLTNTISSQVIKFSLNKSKPG